MENPGYWLRPCPSTNRFLKMIDHVLFEQSRILSSSMIQQQENAYLME